jgi:uncharacterized protein YecT (DUF1311 family)
VIALVAIALAAAAPSGGELAKSERELDRQFGLAIQRLRNCHANTTRCYYWRRTIPRLEREQAAWKSWRDAKTALMAVEMEGTSGERDVRSYFLMQLNESRASDLSKIGRR